MTQLRTFAAVAGSTWEADGRGPDGARAAKECVKRLAKHTGAALVTDYRKGKVKLTAFGAEYAERVKRALEALDHDDTESRLRFVCYPAQLRVAAPIIASFQQQHGLRVDFAPVSNDLRSNDGLTLLSQLEQRAVDVAIAPTDIFDDNYIPLEPIYTWELCAVFDPPRMPESFHGQEILPLDAVCDQALAAAPEGHRSRNLLKTAADQASRALRVVFQHEDPNVLCAIPVVSGVVATVPSDVLHHVDQLSAVPIHAHDYPLGGSYSVLHLDNAAAAALANHLAKNWPDPVR